MGARNRTGKLTVLGLAGSAGLLVAGFYNSSLSDPQWVVRERLSASHIFPLSPGSEQKLQGAWTGFLRQCPHCSLLASFHTRCSVQGVQVLSSRAGPLSTPRIHCFLQAAWASHLGGTGLGRGPLSALVTWLPRPPVCPSGPDLPAAGQPHRGLMGFTSFALLRRE